jgi:hypothetical protein
MVLFGKLLAWNGVYLCFTAATAPAQLYAAEPGGYLFKTNDSKVSQFP